MPPLRWKNSSVQILNDARLGIEASGGSSTRETIISDKILLSEIIGEAGLTLASGGGGFGLGFSNSTKTDNFMSYG